MKNYVVMPKEDYIAVCDSIREKTGSTDAIKSGGMVEKVSKVYEAGQAQGEQDYINFLTNNGTSFSYFFDYKSAWTTVPLLDTSKGTSFIGMFMGCSALTTIPQYDTSNGTRFQYMFKNCKKLTSIPALDFSKGTIFAETFYGCERLEEVPHIDFSKSTNYLDGTFHTCKKLKYLPPIIAPNISSMKQLCYMCIALEEVERIEARGVGSTANSDIFYYCTKLKKIGYINTGSSVALSGNTFYQCSSLEDITFDMTLTDNINFQYSPLTPTSMKNIISHLKNFSGTSLEGQRTISFKSDCWTALEADSTAPDGGTWKDYVNNLGWNT